MALLISTLTPESLLKSINKAAEAINTDLHLNIL
jgi:hypothetical protein